MALINIITASNQPDDARPPLSINCKSITNRFQRAQTRTKSQKQLQPSIGDRISNEGPTEISRWIELTLTELSINITFDRLDEIERHWPDAGASWLFHERMKMMTLEITRSMADEKQKKTKKKTKKTMSFQRMSTSSKVEPVALIRVKHVTGDG